MAFDPPAPTLTYLERLDLALASRLLPHIDSLDLATAPETWSDMRLESTRPGRPIAGLVCGYLELRGIELRLTEVQAVLAGRPGRYERGNQEHAFVVGMARCIGLLHERAREQSAPDGEFAVQLFRTFVGDITRFKNNWLRRDMPWDGFLYVPYPDAGDVPGLLGSFDEAGSYRDVAARFATLHPVRRAFRVLWRLARIAPFPDFNVLVAFLTMNSYLMAKGYPAITPMPGDRELLMKVLAGPPPARLLELEARLAQIA